METKLAEIQTLPVLRNKNEMQATKNNTVASDYIHAATSDNTRKSYQADIWVPWKNRQKWPVFNSPCAITQFDVAFSPKA